MVNNNSLLRVITSGGSMTPFVRPGTTLWVDGAWRCVHVGDIVGFIDEAGGAVAHRVVDIVERPSSECLLRVRGDAQVTVDEVPFNAVTFVARRVEGQWFCYHVESRLGRLIKWVTLRQSTAARLLWRSVRGGASLLERLHRLA